MKALENDTLDSRFQIFESNYLPKDYFLANIPVKGMKYIDFIDQKKGKNYIWISLAITDDLSAISLPNTPFGGIWCDKGVNSTDLDNFLFSVVEALKNRGIKILSITQAPQAYVPQTDLVNSLFFKSGFKLTKLVSHQFFCGPKKIKKFLDSEAPRIRRRMKTNGITASHNSISSFAFLKKIKEWNTAKGYDFSMDEDYLVQQVSNYPERYYLISLQMGEQLIGYALAVFLTSNSVYYFLSALDSKKENKGGGDFLLLELFVLAKEKKVDFIDLGSSEIGDRANHSLMFFKSRFSNNIANKMTWCKEL